MEANIERIESLVRQIIVELGENPEREGLLRSPQRMAASLAFLTSGYDADIDESLNVSGMSSRCSVE